jgi:5'-AMP-activated protein kinase regulatory beta subunit
MPRGKSKEKAKRRKVTLSIGVPNAKDVILMGDFNKWEAKKHPMHKGKDGLWTKTVMLLPGRYEYKFLVDGQWQNDPGNDHACLNPFGTHNNVIVVSSR